MAVDYESIYSQLKMGIADIAKKSFKKRVSEVTAEGEKMLNLMDSDIKRWSDKLAAGKLSEDDYKDLVLGQKDLLKMITLKEAGLTKIQADQFKQDVLNLVVNTILKAI